MREHLQVMWDLSRLLRARRLRRGALDFDPPEAKVILDPESQPGARRAEALARPGRGQGPTTSSRS